MNSWKVSPDSAVSIILKGVFFFSICRVAQWRKKRVELCLWINASVPMPELQWLMQLVRASDQNSEDPGSNSGWISMSFHHLQYHIVLHNQRCINHNNNVCQGLLIHCHVMPYNQGHINSKFWCNLVSHMLCPMKFYIDYCQNTPSLHVLCRVPYAESHKNLIRTSQYLITVSNKRFGTVTQASYKKNCKSCDKILCNHPKSLVWFL